GTASTGNRRSPARPWQRLRRRATQAVDELPRTFPARDEPAGGLTFLADTSLPQPSGSLGGDRAQKAGQRPALSLCLRFKRLFHGVIKVDKYWPDHSGASIAGEFADGHR